MYRKTLLPQCLAVGITAEYFWNAYPVEIEPYFEAQRIRRRIHDEEAWMNGLYTMEAFGIALHNAFRKKNEKPIEYRKQPILYEDRPLTKRELEEKAQREADKVFHRLEIARFNQELAEMRNSGG